MVDFDRTQRSFIEKVIREQVDQEQVAEVIAVREHDAPNDTSNFECDVQMEGRTIEQNVTPVFGPHNEKMSVPKVGDKVMVGYLAGESGQAYITHGVPTTQDRPPLGKAGIVKEEVDSGTSPAGDGNLYVTKYTGYDGDPADTEAADLTPEETLIRLAKKNDSADPTTDTDIPASVEFYDAPANDEAHITVRLNKRDGADSTATWGLKFNLKTGEVKLVDPSGYGIVSDGDGNFTWEYETKTENQVSGGGSLSL